MRINFGQCSAVHATLAAVLARRPSDWLAAPAITAVTAWNWPGSPAKVPRPGAGRRFASADPDRDRLPWTLVFKFLEVSYGCRGISIPNVESSAALFVSVRSSRPNLTCKGMRAFL